MAPRVLSCTQCRDSKIKCSKSYPCFECTSRGKTCVWKGGALPTKSSSLVTVETLSSENSRLKAEQETYKKLLAFLSKGSPDTLSTISNLFLRPHSESLIPLTPVTPLSPISTPSPDPTLFEQPLEEPFAEESSFPLPSHSPPAPLEPSAPLPSLSLHSHTQTFPPNPPPNSMTTFEPLTSSPALDLHWQPQQFEFNNATPFSGFEPFNSANQDFGMVYPGLGNEWTGMGTTMGMGTGIWT